MEEEQTSRPRLLRVATWNMDHWKRTVSAREAGWVKLTELAIDIALLQETVPPRSIARDRVVYRPIGGRRGWGSAVVAVCPNYAVDEIDVVRTRYSPQLFSMLGSVPGAVVVARTTVPDFGSVAFVSVYGMIEVYAQTTMFRIVADLIPLFDSPEGQHVVLGGDFNVSTASNPDKPEWKRYDAILRAVEALGLVHLAEVVPERPPAPPCCSCHEPACRHLITFNGSQMDYLYATPELAKRAQRLLLPADTSVLSDHVPIVCEFDLTTPLLRTEWDPRSFAALLAERFGLAAGVVVENLLVWVNRKQDDLQRLGYRDIRLDRLPFVNRGTETEMYFQLDRRNSKGFQWTCSIRSDGNVVIQFQHMSAPFDNLETRRRIWERLTAIPGVRLEPRLNGRPTFLLTALTGEQELGLFVQVLDYIVDETLGASRDRPHQQYEAEASQATESAVAPSPFEEESA
ncbi:MAG TPA: endonuclease/exonuclease/phosphatase family protein [Chloroflexota bacterium]|nr:endonuclease/exonuclease/phosphatase family protein [Chloroflexota bacterium]